MPSITKTATSMAPSNQSDLPSIVMFLRGKYRDDERNQLEAIEKQVQRFGQKQAGKHECRGYQKRDLRGSSDHTAHGQVHLVLTGEDRRVHDAGNVAHRGQQDDTGENFIDSQLSRRRARVSR